MSWLFYYSKLNICALSTYLMEKKDIVKLFIHARYHSKCSPPSGRTCPLILPIFCKIWKNKASSLWNWELRYGSNQLQTESELEVVGFFQFILCSTVTYCQLKTSTIAYKFGKVDANTGTHSHMMDCKILQNHISTSKL
jgi:hypothetical protein